jgi:hypothetical protein
MNHPVIWSKPLMPVGALRDASIPLDLKVLMVPLERRRPKEIHGRPLISLLPSLYGQMRRNRLCEGVHYGLCAVRTAFVPNHLTPATTEPGRRCSGILVQGHLPSVSWRTERVFVAGLRCNASALEKAMSGHADFTC